MNITLIKTLIALKKTLMALEEAVKLFPPGGMFSLEKDSLESCCCLDLIKLDPKYTVTLQEVRQVFFRCWSNFIYH